MPRFRMRRSGVTGEAAAPPDLLTSGGQVWHSTSDAVARPLRYALTRWHVQDKGGLHPTLAVTSTLRGEGVTFVSRSMADLIASDLQRSVCLVDLNWWSPSTPPGQPAGTGVSDVLRGLATMDDVLVPTGNPMLWVLPAGEADARERAVLAQSPDLRDVVEGLAARFDHLVLDVPALRSCSESLALAALADGAVVVIRHGATTLEQAQAALGELAFAPVLGVVLNRAASRVPRWIRERIAGA